MVCCGIRDTGFPDFGLWVAKQNFFSFISDDLSLLKAEF